MRDGFRWDDHLRGAPDDGATAEGFGNTGHRQFLDQARQATQAEQGECPSYFRTTGSTFQRIGFDIGQAHIAPFTGSAEPLTINIKNEYLVATQGERLLASVPDLITVVDYETSTPINAERLRFGQRVTVLGVGCPAFYRTQRALQYVAPRCFGFPFDYQPIGNLTSSDPPEQT